MPGGAPPGVHHRPETRQADFRWVRDSRGKTARSESTEGVRVEYLRCAPSDRSAAVECTHSDTR
ncbi:hypothetical protein C8Q73DRAFT_693684 [Cubamyces lactineus]|nr:hypothetical protein C8Q73DRAFT_699896 [Cubamyces lactineus]KAH9895295.1 hypothetical protein C8Q73DRAFT_693684 [Cubamyces lactineus]